MTTSEFAWTPATTQDLPALRENFSQTVWAASAHIREAIDACPFVTALGDGTLDLPAFVYYLDQDALYLNQYSRALSRTGDRAPDVAARLFYYGGAVGAVEVEAEMHRTWTARYSDHAQVTGIPGLTTQAYTDFLLARTNETFGIAAAAVLPCYWLYAHIGTTLYTALQNYEGEHPYREWLETYSGEDFQKATEQAIAYTDAAARTATDDKLLAMYEAYMRASWLELTFFEAPLTASSLAQGTPIP